RFAGYQDYHLASDDSPWYSDHQSISESYGERMITILKSFITEKRRRWIALAVVCMGQLMMVLDATIVNVALPSMQRDLGFSQANLAWVIDAYMIAFGSFLLLAGRLGDLLGRKR